ncbi:MAG: DUF6943 family protein [Bacteroidia bacterium]
MKQFTLKTYSSSTANEQNCFYILNKGMNSGKPFPKPFCNSFVFIADNEVERDIFYWITFAAWQGKLFIPYLKGSVIPFITILDTTEVIKNASKNCIANNEKITNLVETFTTLNNLELKYADLTKLTAELKRGAALKFIKA